MKREVIVVANAYNKERLAQPGGQQALLPIVAAAGADGIEIRRELFDDAALRQLPETGATIRAHGLIAFYSVPDALFNAGGALNPNLARFFNEAEQLGARQLKFSLGHFSPGTDCRQLREIIEASDVRLLVENDQTDCGRMAALEAWFEDGGTAYSGMTFDTGNWLWVAEDPLEAAARLGRFVSYVHVKAVKEGRAVAPDGTDDLWRRALAALPDNVPRGIEFPLEGSDPIAVTRHYVDLLREV
ncbi:TIM barrel protein [Erwinia sp. 9145]|uniref:sugar phosphate isomerase/epimerase family protein n=1 Tax=Erwinia sp. 9145 TaxID=1500895 RepID=UPI00055062AC|nr:TIM barrel protein [Erwinia sp. 9145]